MASMTRPEFITQILSKIEEGSAGAARRLLPLVYDELRRLARQFFRSERQSHTLQPTALVHEAFLRLTGGQKLRCQNRYQFFAIAAKAMRNLLIDHARKHQAAKRRGDGKKLDWRLLTSELGTFDFDMLQLDEAVRRLDHLDPRCAQIVELRFFGGLTWDEIAAIQNCSVSTIKRDWQTARAWLRRELHDDT